MDDSENRPKSERFFPQGQATLSGAKAKMQFLKESSQILVGQPLKQQILCVLSKSSEPQTVHGISQVLCLNTKTCAKILQEMVYKYKDLSVTAHRYGRVFVHKYQILPKVEETPQLNPYLQPIEAEIGPQVEDAMRLNLTQKNAKRQRVTHQTYERALFILAKLKEINVTSVFEMKEMIRNELEPQAQWVLDKKTVLRIIWKLQTVKLLRQMCFRIVLMKSDENEVEYLGDEYSCIDQDKKNLKDLLLSNKVIYKVLLSLPEVSENDPLVQNYPALLNPTNRKPITVPPRKLSTSGNRIKSKRLKSIVSQQNIGRKKFKSQTVHENTLENINQMEKFISNKEDSTETLEFSQEDNSKLSKAYKLAVFAKWVSEFGQSLITARYNLLFSCVKLSTTYSATKNLLNKYSKEPSEKLSLAYKSVNLPKLEKSPCSAPQKTNKPLRPVSKKKKLSYNDCMNSVQKLLLSLEQKSRFQPKLDCEEEEFLEFLQTLGITHKKLGQWHIKDFKFL